MTKRGRFLYKDTEGNICIKFEHPGKGVPLESLLPESGRGAGFADFRITDYLNLADMILAAPQDWRHFIQNADFKQGTKENPVKVVPPSPNLDFLNLRNSKGDMDANRASELFSIVGRYWSAPPNELAIAPGVVATLWRSGVEGEEIIRYVREFTDTNGKLTIPAGRGFEIMNAVIETYKEARAIPPDDGLVKEMVADLMQQWLRATRSAAIGSKDIANTVLHLSDMRRLGLVDADARADLEQVRKVAVRIFTEENVTFEALVAWVDENSTSGKMSSSASSQKTQALLKKKRKQGRLNRKRGRR